MTPIQQMFLGIGGVLQKMFGDKAFLIAGKTGAGTSVNDITNSVDIQVISTGANATDFGDLAYNLKSQVGSSMSDGSKAYHHVGLRWYSNQQSQYMTYQILTFTGGISNSGYDLSQDGTYPGRYACKATSNGNRGCWMGGNTYGSGSGATYKLIDYITFAALSDAANFGQLLISRSSMATGNCNNKTRGLCYNGASSGYHQIDYIVVDTTSNAYDFGDWAVGPTTNNGRTQNQMCSNETRGFFTGGGSPTGIKAVIGYVTIDTTGNALDFGDLVTGYYNKQEEGFGYANDTRGVMAGGDGGVGSTHPNNSQRSCYWTIDTLGDATNGGQLTTGRAEGGSCSGD